MGEQVIDCKCSELWTARESCWGDGGQAYTHTFMISSDCPVHWERYMEQMKMIEEMREDAAHQ